MTWIPTYTRSLARRKAARVTFKPSHPQAGSSHLPAPPQRQSKRGRDVDSEDSSPKGRAAARRRTVQGEEASKQAKEIAHHILEAVNHIARRREALPEYGAMRALAAPQPLPSANPPALTVGAWESLSTVSLPSTRHAPQLSHLTPCTSVQAELARREHEQRIQNLTPASPSAEAAGADHITDGFSFPAAQAVSEVMQQGKGSADGAGEGAPAGLRATLDAFGMMAGPPQTLKPPMTIAQALQHRRDEEAAAEKRRVDSQPQIPAVPVFEPPQPAGTEVMPTLDKFMEARRKVGLPKPTNPCDFLKPLPGEEEVPSPQSVTDVAPAAASLGPAPVPEARDPPTMPPQPAMPEPAVKGPTPASGDEPKAEQPKADQPLPDRLTDDRPAKRRAPVVSGWGDAFLKQNKAEEAAAKDDIAKEIESRNPLASKPSGPSVAFGSGVYTHSFWFYLPHSCQLRCTV